MCVLEANYCENFATDYVYIFIRAHRSAQRDRERGRFSITRNLITSRTPVELKVHRTQNLKFIHFSCHHTSFVTIFSSNSAFDYGSNDSYECVSDGDCHNDSRCGSGSDNDSGAVADVGNDNAIQ